MLACQIILLSEPIGYFLSQSDQSTGSLSLIYTTTRLPKYNSHGKPIKLECYVSQSDQSISRVNRVMLIIWANQIRTRICTRYPVCCVPDFTFLKFKYENYSQSIDLHSRFVFAITLNPFSAVCPYTYTGRSF